MKTFTTKEKQSPAVSRSYHYVHYPMSPVQQTQQAEIRRILRSTGAQAKLTVGQPNDKYEQEADRVADQVMAMPDPNLQRQPEGEEEMAQRQPMEEEEEEPIQAKPSLQRQPVEQGGEEEESIQTKHTVGSADDEYEKEADRVADQIVQMKESDVNPLSLHENNIHRVVEGNSEKSVMGKGKSKENSGAGDLPIRLDTCKGGGGLLPKSDRRDMEKRFGQDFSTVRIHTDNSSVQMNQELGARAFTRGHDIFFNSGEYSSSSAEGKHLLAHELTHVVQQRSANTVMPVVQLLRARGLVSRERNYIVRKYTWFINQLSKLERNGTITSDEAEEYTNSWTRAIREARGLASRRKTSRPEARRLWLRGRRLLRYAKNVGRARRQLIRRARLYRGSSRRLTLLSRMTIVPRKIRIHKGESARISFNLRRKARSISWYILESEGSGDLTGRMAIRQFKTSNNNPGYKYAYWNGTFTGSRNRPPETRTYRVRLTVKDTKGRSEGVADQIRVENPRNQVVHPRHGSGYPLLLLTFDGKKAVLSDDQGNQITARAVSGLRRRHRRNRRRIDYTKSRYQWTPNRGPIPEGKYTMASGQVQQPALIRGRLRYPASRGATASVWGIGRIALRPYSRPGPRGVTRSAFFFHLDVKNDGTAGCIGIHPGDVGKFNSMISLIRRMGGKLTVIVRY